MKDLLIIPFWTYNDVALDLMKKSAEKYDSVCYVTLNKTFKSLSDSLKKERLEDKFYFVDLITPNLLKYQDEYRCIFIDNIRDIEKFADKIIDFINDKLSKLIIFDSVSSLLVYKEDKEAIDFFAYLLPLLDRLQVDVKLLVQDMDRERPLMEKLTRMADNTDELKKGWLSW